MSGRDSTQMALAIVGGIFVGLIFGTIIMLLWIGA